MRRYRIFRTEGALFCAAGTSPTGFAVGLAAAIVLSGAFFGCTTVSEMLKATENPTARISSARFSGLDAESISVTFDVEITNPYPVSLPLLGLDYRLSSAGTPFLTGAAKDTGAILPGDKKIVPVMAKIPFLATLALLEDVRPGNVVPYTASFTINARAPGLGVVHLPLETDGEFPIPVPPRVGVSSLDWESLSLTNAVAVLNIEVTNGNDFPLSMTRLAVDLALAKASIATTTIEEPHSFGAGEGRVLPVRLSLRPGQLGMAVFRMLSQSSVSYDLAGDISFSTGFGALSLPISSSGTTPMSRLGSP